MFCLRLYAGCRVTATLTRTIYQNLAMKPLFRSLPTVFFKSQYLARLSCLVSRAIGSCFVEQRFMSVDTAMFSRAAYENNFDFLSKVISK